MFVFKYVQIFTHLTTNKLLKIFRL